MKYLTSELLYISDPCRVSAAEFFWLFWPLLCVGVLLELNFHKLVLAPRTSSKVEVFSYRAVYVGAYGFQQTIRHTEVCWCGVFTWEQPHLGWMDGMILPGLPPFPGMEMWLDPAPFALCSPVCSAVLLLPWSK